MEAPPGTTHVRLFGRGAGDTTDLPSTVSPSRSLTAARLVRLLRLVKSSINRTVIDPETFQDYLASMSDLYTASAYHLTDFNCNNFTADVVGFLSGADIPSWISGMPSEFLSTPFGQAIRPQ